MAERLTVEVARVRFATEDGGFAVLDATSDDGEPVVLAGPLAHAHAGDAMEVAGAWREHPRHGRQFQVTDVRIAEPTSDQALLALLSGIKHIGSTGAAFLLERHGSDVLAVVDADPHARLREVPGIGPIRIGPAVAAWREARALRAVRLFLDSHGVPAAVAGRVIRALGADAVDVLTVDPYKLTELEGIGFATADALARALGVPADDPRRLAAGVVYVLREAESDGHTFLPRDELRERARRLLGADPDAALEAVALSGSVVVEDDRVADARLHRIESRLGERIRDLLEDEPAHELELPERPTDGAFVPTEAQWHAVQRALAGRLSILTGGPGVGKCLHGDTLVVVNDDLTPISALWDETAAATYDGEGWWAAPTRQLIVPSLSDDGQMVPAEVTRLYRQRVSEYCREITLADGSTLIATKAHQFLRADGWTADISVGDRICVPGHVPHAHGCDDTDLATLLAWQIAEGSERGGSARIHQKDVAVLERIRDAALAVGDRYALRLGMAAIVAPAKRCAYLSLNSVSYRDFLCERGYLWGSRSAGKRIPPIMMGASADAVRVFLREFFAAESHVAASRRRIEISSASRHLLLQLQIMLRRFGVWMVIRPTEKAATNGRNIRRTYYEGAITGPSLRRFHDRLGIADAAKQSALFAAVTAPSNPNIDTVPISDLLRAAKPESGLSRQFFGLSSSYFSERKEPSRFVAWRTLAHMRDIADGSAGAAYEAKVSALTTRAGHRCKARTRAAFAAIDCRRMSDLAGCVDERIRRDTFYAEVVAVRDVFVDDWVYDLTVDAHHNFVGGGMLCHNTASLKMLVDVLHAGKLRAVLCAPTGKAARRMSEATGAEASTIHRLLGWQPGEGFVHGPGDPIPGCDVLIVDEVSMLDVRLAGVLFGAVGRRTHVVLVGDPDQLAPVGAGRVLGDLLASEAVPVTRLTEVFRQAARSLIVRTAHALNEGRPPPRDVPEDVVRDFYFVGRGRASEIFDEVVSLAADRLPRHLALDPRADVQVLAPMHKGPVGIDAFNEALRSRLNPDGEPIPGTTLRVGDRVVQTRNDYERLLMNGEVGVLVSHDREAGETLLATDDGRVLTMPTGSLDTLRLAHAMSVHKAQGSSAPAVVVPLFSGHRIMLTRNLVYTALTRAERMAVFVGEPAALDAALRRVDAGRRHTRLAELVIRD
jgi:ATP-dependent exoDNAse (exonuclease V) alpha subunit